VDTAAARAGFKASGRTSAANRLARSMRAVGLGIMGDMRDKGKHAAKPEQIAARV
jgi:molybdopterin-guanine dinucleotide biosynthesis protein